MIFSIQRYCLHDGPGIRTTVFLKGCPLRCAWCSNPESQNFWPELAWSEAGCIKCGACLRELPGVSALGERGIQIIRETPADPDAVREACPSGALHFFGERKTVQEILDAAEADSIFYGSDGGLTLSGGEPFAQPEFALALLREAKARRIHTAAETCGFVSWDALYEAGRLLDFLIYDIKSLNEALLKSQTGGLLEVSLENFKRFKKAFKPLPVLVRTPVIPGFNDSLLEIEKIVEFLAPFEGVSYELLKYHRFAGAKYKALGRPVPYPENFDEEAYGYRFDRLEDFVKKAAPL
ncbi:MAG: glycyl-radical enzyme activating protein [Clostridiales bacterium]|nr:glycyl-radical enzyme activating protein [Clostridiales bacterium]